MMMTSLRRPWHPMYKLMHSRKETSFILKKIYITGYHLFSLACIDYSNSADILEESLE